jgi:CdiI immunity protein
MSRQDILDDPAAACPQLQQFLAAYFHQDWAADRPDWESVVDDFIAESPGSVVVDTTHELRDLLAAGLRDDELGSVLDGLGGSVLPSAFGLTTTAWLAEVLRRISATG